MADHENARTRTPESLIPALQASGFPFQTAVAAVVKASPGWTVAEVELPWKSDSGDNFLDLVGEHRSRCVIATIECKKTEKDALVFLTPSDARSVHDERMRGLYAHQIKDMTRRLELDCDEWLIDPTSPEAAFCVVSTTSSGKDQRLLERDVAQLVRATDAYADRRRVRFTPRQEPEPTRLFVPLLVTNAPLFVARYVAGEVPLDTGRVAISHSDLSRVPWVRFRKAFTSYPGRDFGDRTAFVVTAENLSDFLSKLGTHIEGASSRGRA